MRVFFWLFFVLGLTGMAVCFYYAALDWRELQRAHAFFVSVAGADLKTVFIAESKQNIHRINLFADGVWALLSAILSVLCALGIQRK